MANCLKCGKLAPSVDSGEACATCPYYALALVSDKIKRIENAVACRDMDGVRTLTQDAARVVEALKVPDEKPRFDREVRVKAYDLLEKAVEEGLAWGWQRAHKHTDTPTRDHVVENMEREIMNAIHEVFDFGDE